MIIVASSTRESGKRKICDYIMREMMCSQMKTHDVSILLLTFIALRRQTSSVQSHFDFNNGAVFFVFVYITELFNLNTDEKIYIHPFTIFVPGKWMSRLFRILRISTHITTFHSLVKRSEFHLLFFSLVFFFFSRMRRNYQHWFKKIVKHNFGR